MIRILIVDDQKSFRDDLTNLLKSELDLQVVGTADDGHGAIEQIKILHPDLVLLDMEMPNLDGGSTIQILCNKFPGMKVLAVSSDDSEDYINKAFAAGAMGYLFKQKTSAAQLKEAIWFVHKGYARIGGGQWVNINSPIPEKKAVNTVNGYSEPKPPLIPKSLHIATPEEFLPNISRRLTWAGFACLVIFGSGILLASVLKFKTTVKAPAILRPVGELRLVQAATEGTISRIEVKDNQVIESGEAIAYLEDSRLQTKKKQLQASIAQNQQQIQQMDAQRQTLDRQLAAGTDNMQRAIASAKAELKLNQRQYEDRKITTVAEVTEAEASLELAQEELSKYQQLANTGAIPQLQLREREAALKTAKARLQRVQAAINPSNAAVAMAEEKIAQTRAIGEASVARLNQEKEELVQRRTEIEARVNSDRYELQQIATELKNTVIRAPVSGIIQKLNLRNPKQVVRPGDEIAQIAPRDAPLIVKAFVDSADIGKVETKQNVQIRVSACPYPDYGILQGTVSAVSPDVFMSQNQSSGALKTYEVTIKPESFQLKAGNQKCILQAGMEGTADVVSKEETLLQFILKKGRLLTNL
jgi:HlyD family secretion protein